MRETRAVSRRQAIGWLGAAGVGAVVLGACGGDDGGSSSSDGSTTSTTTGTGGTLTAADFATAGSCAVARSLTEGPYYIDVDKIRSDIREDREGVRLRLGTRVLDADGCTPVKDAVFEIWQCDAAGLYSGFEAASQGRPGRGLTDAERYLRGAQVTDADPYDQQNGWRTTNADDGIFSADAVLTTRRDGDGYLGLITIGVKA